MGKFLGDVHRLHLADEDLGVLRNLKACQLGDLIRGLTYDLGVESAVDQDGLADFIQLVAL